MPEISAPHLTGNAQALDQAVTDRVAESLLEPVEAVVEAPAQAVVIGKGEKGLAQLIRAARAQL